MLTQLMCASQAHGVAESGILANGRTMLPSCLLGQFLSHLAIAVANDAELVPVTYQALSVDVRLLHLGFLPLDVGAVLGNAL